MAGYIARRLLFLPIILFFVSLMTFTIFRIVPGDPVVVMLGPKYRPEVAERLREELTDRYGRPPEEGERLLDAHLLRLLGRGIGIERIFVKDREARITFRASATPRMTALEAPLRDRQLRVEVRRMVPLSLALEQAGPEPVTRTLIRALDAVAGGQTKKDAA